MHHGQRRPWVALAVGLFPVIGNLAYPLQLLFTSLERNGGLARFISLRHNGGDGPGMVTCFEAARSFAASGPKLTYPLPCDGAG